MHLSDGVLSPVLIAATSVLGTGMVAWSLKGLKTEEIPKISLMTALFVAASMVRFPIGATSVHLLLTGLIGLVAGRRTAVVLAVALTLQLFLLQFGGLSSLGANILIESVPATLLGMILSARLTQSPRRAFWYGLTAGSLAILGSAVLLCLFLIQSNMRFGAGPFSTVRLVLLGHVPLMVIEGMITAFAVQLIVRIRPEIFVSVHGAGKT